MERNLDQRLAVFAEQNHGVFTTVHAQSLGMSPQTIKTRLESSRWVCLHESVYRIGGAPLTWKGRLLAACWAGGFRAVASHRSAAALYGLAGGRQDIAEITCPRWLRARHDGLVVHETKAPEPWDIHIVDGIPATSPERTLFDLGAVKGITTVMMGFDKARRIGLVSYRSTERTLFRLARPGRPGSRILRFVLDQRSPSLSPPESEMETLTLEAIRRHGLPPPIPQYVITANGRFLARPDLAYPDDKLAIEYQSIEWHADHDALIRDSARRNRLYAIGWSVVDVTKPELAAGGDNFCTALASQLALASRRAQ
jgi:hypothetical protein